MCLPDHTDVVRQVEVGAHGPGALIAHSAGVEVHDLPAAVDTGVGTPGADHRNRLVRDFGQCLLQGLLDTWHAAGLALPAAVTRAFVFHAQGDAGVAFGRGFGGGGVDDVQAFETCGVYEMAGIITTTAAV